MVSARLRAVAAVLCCVAPALSGATAQEYPVRPVRIVTGFPGAMMDIVCRQLGPRLGERWGKSVIVDNRGVNIAPAVVAVSAPDGYTLMMADSTWLAVRPNLYKSLPYDPERDFAPITLVATSPQLLVAHPSVPAANLGEFMAYARAQQRGVDFATGGPATATHLGSEIFAQLTGVRVVSVNYKGGGAALLAIVGGETKAGFSQMFLSLPHVKAGRVKAYGITSKKRFAGAPDVPTMAEGGIALENSYWFGILAPARTPPALVGRLNREVVKLLQTPEMKSVLLEQGAEPGAGTPEEFNAFIRSETARLRKVIELAGIKPD